VFLGPTTVASRKPAECQAPLLWQEDLPERLRIKGCITLEDLFGLPTESKKVQEFDKAMRRDEEKTGTPLFLRLFET
jgi:hypothetical protein